jgi:hypothetical protein
MPAKPPKRLTRIWRRLRGALERKSSSDKTVLRHFERLEPRRMLAALLRAYYQDDFQLGAPAANWHYLWNAPADWSSDSTDASTGQVGDPSGYVSLGAAVDGYTTTGASNPTVAPAQWLSLGPNGGHAGGGRYQTFGIDNIFDRFAIAAWTASEGGFYAISESILATPDARSSGVEVFVHVGDRAGIHVAANSVNGRSGR